MNNIQNFEKLLEHTNAPIKSILEIDRLSSMLIQAKDLAEKSKSEGLQIAMELYQAHAENIAQALKNRINLILQDILK